MTFNQNWNRAGGEGRTEAYRTWRTTLKLGAVCDVDQLECRYGRDRRLYVVGVVELCVADAMSEAVPAGVRPGQSPSPAFLRQLEAKVAPGRFQGDALRLLAQTFHVPIWLVTFVLGDLDRGVWVHVVGAQGWRSRSLHDFRHDLAVLPLPNAAYRRPPVNADTDAPLTVDDIPFGGRR